MAEKLQTMVALGIANSRMKDFFEFWFLATNFEFDGLVLARAIQVTFGRRNTALPKTVPFALTESFSVDTAKTKQWKVFVSKTTLLPKTTTLDQVVAAIGQFVLPPLNAARGGSAFNAIWNPHGPWQ